MICAECASKCNVYFTCNTLTLWSLYFDIWTFETVCATTRDQNTVFPVQSVLFFKLTKTIEMRRKLIKCSTRGRFFYYLFPEACIYPKKMISAVFNSSQKMICKAILNLSFLKSCHSIG